MTHLLSFIASLALGAATFASNSVCLIILHEIDMPDSVHRLVKK